jgi:tetratricopeptide (TPR) repeat protein
MDRMSRRIIIGIASFLVTMQVQAQAPRWNELRNQFTLLFQQERYALATDVAREAVSVAAGTFGTNHPNVAESMGHLAMALAQKGHYGDAITLYRNAIEIREKAFGVADTARLRYVKRLADVMYWEGDYPEARTAYEEVIARSNNTSGTESLTGAMRGLAEVAFEEEKYAEAEALLQQASAEIASCCGIADPLYRSTMLRLAAVYVADRQNNAAEATYRNVIATIEEHVGRNAAELAPALTGLARLIDNDGEAAEATTIYRRIIDVDEARYGEMAPAVAADMETLVAHYLRQNQFAEAAPYAEKVVRIWGGQMSAPALNVARANATLAAVDKGLGNSTAAASAYERAIAVAGDHGEIEYTVRYLADLATLYTSIADLPAAKKTMERAFSVIEHRGGISPEMCGTLRGQYSEILRAMNQGAPLTDVMQNDCSFSRD